MAFIENDDGYVVFEASDDDEEFDSSDDEEEFFPWKFHAIDGNKRKQTQVESNEFENEMNRELDNTLTALHASHGIVSTMIRPSTSTENPTSRQQAQFYDEVYFDSDSDTEDAEQSICDLECRSVCDGRSYLGKRRSKKSKHPIVSNDDLFYDPNADDEDQKWVDKRRMRCKPAERRQGTTSGKLPTSDAVLNCPACMTTLCRDCQRHDIYKGQYRAMFVSNCKIDLERSLRYPKSKTAQRKEPSSVEPDASYNPVHCLVCNTNVAVYDTNEVYHFFNVLTSYN